MAARRTPRDAITDVPGIRVGHWTDRRAATGCTVVLCPSDGAVAAGVVMGGAPGTRETDALSPGNVVKRAHAVLLTGGSAFGLDAAGGVMRWLEGRGIGHPMRNVRVPIVPAAVIYDLGIGRADVRPDVEAGYAACEAAGATVRQGSIGAGTGATVAKVAGLERALKGGVGTASERHGSGAVVGAIAVVNAVGEIVDPERGVVVAGVRPVNGCREPVLELLRHRHLPPPTGPENTTIAVIATDLALDREQVYRLALMGHTAIARAVRPSHTPGDGETVFALATGTRVEERVDLTAVGALAARALERAVLNGVRHATGLVGVPAAGSSATLRAIVPGDRTWIEEATVRDWGAATVVSRGVVHHPAGLPGFVAEVGGSPMALITLHVEGDACEVVTMNAYVGGAGYATALMNAAEAYAREQGCRRLWLVTTNDNIHALRFYQRRGMSISAVRLGAVDDARARKPEIPLTGNDGIPLHDEIELAKSL